MKKFLLLLIGLSFFQGVEALPLDNPALPTLLETGLVWTSPAECGVECLPCWQQWSLRAGYYGDYVFDRKLKSTGGGETIPLKQTQISTHAGYLALNWADWIDAFVTLGSSQMDILCLQSAWDIFGRPSNYCNVETETAFSWSGGLRATLCDWRCFSLGIEGQYFYTKPTVNTFRVQTLPFIYEDFAFKYQEWQVGLGASYRVNVFSPHSWFVPYIGVDWSKVWVTTGNAHSAATPGQDPNVEVFFNVKNQTTFGYAIGLTVIGSERWSVTGEARFVNERAFYFNAQFRL